jgi:DoxX-like family
MTTSPSKTIWIGRVLSALAILFLLFDAIVKLLQLQVAVDGTTQLGYPASLVFGIGVVEIVCLAVHVIPQTSVFGAILFTGYLGGAIATHVRIGSPLFTHVLFPIYVAVLLWGGLYAREDRLRSLIPIRR